MATCKKCGALLSAVEAAGRETGTCNECLRRRSLRQLNRTIAQMMRETPNDPERLASVIELRDLLRDRR